MIWLSYDYWSTWRPPYQHLRVLVGPEKGKKKGQEEREKKEKRGGRKKINRRGKKDMKDESKVFGKEKKNS